MIPTNVISAPAAGAALRHGRRSIGSILVDAGRLKAEDSERILRLQREQNLRFGDAALRLKLITQEDIDFALSRQFDYPYLRAGESKVSEKVVAAYVPFSPQVEALRGLRSQLMLRWFDSDASHKALAVVSAARKDGRSFLAANLAVVFSQLGESTLLVDGDLRHPCQHELFGLENRTGLSAMLSGRAGMEAVQRIPTLLDLSVLTAGATPPNPLELLSRAPFTQLLNDLSQSYDVVLFDTPSAVECADAQAVAVRTGASLVVARRNASRVGEVRAIADAVRQSGGTVVGTVLNDF